MSWLSRIGEGATDLWHSTTHAASGVASTVADVAAHEYQTRVAAANEAGGYIHRAEEAITGGLHWAEDQVDHGTHALARRVENVPVLGGAARGLADAATFQAQFAGGVVGGATSLVGGLANAVVHPIDTVVGLETMAEHTGGPLGQSLRLGHGMIDLARGRTSFGDVMDRSFNPLREQRENGAYWTNVGSALIDPYRRSWREGRYGEVAGRGAFDIGLLLSGVGEAEAANVGRAGEVANAGRVAEATRGAQIARGAEEANVAREASQIGRTGSEASQAGRTGEVAQGGRHAAGGGFVDQIDQAAEAAYDGIRANRGDVSAIARNTRLPEGIIQRVKNHLFNNEHRLATVEGEAAQQSRFVANERYAHLWRRAEAGTLTAEESHELMNLVTHENVEATLAERGLDILEPVEQSSGMRPFRARRAHDLAGIAERNFDPRLFNRIPPEVRGQYLRAMVESTMDVRGGFSPEALAGMPEEVQQMIQQINRERAATRAAVPPPGSARVPR